MERQNSADISGFFEFLVVICIVCRLGFPGNLTMVAGGNLMTKLADYGSSVFQVLLMLLGSGGTLMEFKLLDFKRKYKPIYWMLGIIFLVSLLVTDSISKQLTMIFHFSLTAFFGLWMADYFEEKRLLELLYYAQIFIILANLLTLFVFRGAGFYHEDGYGLTFRGLYTQKNGLGGEMALGAIMQMALAFVKLRSRELLSNSFLLVFLVQLSMLVVSQSTSSMLTVFMAAVFLIHLYLHRDQEPRYQWGFLYTVINILFLFGTSTILPIIAPMLEALGKDATLTGRTPMWAGIIAFMQTSHTFTGYGLLHFWETPAAIRGLQGMYERNSWYRTMLFGAHNQLLELWLDIGLIGIAVYFTAVYRCFRRVKYLTSEQYVICSLIMIPILLEGLADRLFTNSNFETFYFFLMLGTACWGTERRWKALAEEQRAARTGRYRQVEDHRGNADPERRKTERT